MVEIIKSCVFKLVSELDIKGLLCIPPSQVRPVLPMLVRMSLCPSLDSSNEWKEKKKVLLQLLSGLDAVNGIIALLSVDFHELEEDARNEQKSVRKNYAASTSCNLLKSQKNILDFERSNPCQQFHILISELIPVMMLCEMSDTPLKKVESEIFSADAYIEEISDVLCILCTELPSVFDFALVAHALLFFPNGQAVLCKLVANNPACFMAICQKLFQINDEKPGHSAAVKVNTSLESLICNSLTSLCLMNDGHALAIRSLCVKHCQMPDLAVRLTLKYMEDINKSQVDGVKVANTKAVNNLVLFASGLLLGNDPRTRSWFATYIRHTKDSKQNPLRKHLFSELLAVVKSAEIKAIKGEFQGNSFSQRENNAFESMHLLLDEQCIRASALIRLYCAMKAIGGIKFTTQESDNLLLLITCFPPLTPSGIRFVSLALGMLLACPALLLGSSEEGRVIKWVQWLAIKSSEMENVGPDGCSFAEQLLLTAIHLHGDRRSAAVRLACSTLGMRIKVNSSSFAPVKRIFTEEVFPTQRVAAHAMKVPITKQLNASIGGYLPVHCVYQLLKTRAFSQGRIPVKDWIYRQLCSTASPLHPQLQPLIQQYVCTVVSPASKNHSHHNSILNEPFTEAEVLKVFKNRDNSDAEQPANRDESHNNYSLTSRLLMLYYVLLYEDSMLSNMKQLAPLPNRPVRYSPTLINQIPVKLLLYKAQRQPKACQGLYPGLIGLLSTQLPHLCLVEDWMHEIDNLHSLNFSIVPASSVKLQEANQSITGAVQPESLYNGLRRAHINPAPALMHLHALSNPQISADDIIKYANPLAWGLPYLLNSKVSRRVRQETLKLWLRLNSLIPRRLWVLTVNALLPNTTLVHSEKIPSDSVVLPIDFDSLINDPLLPLGVDAKVLQCPEFLVIVLRILSACISASQSQVIAMCKANPVLTKFPQPARSTSPTTVQVNDTEKEELQSAFCSAQQSAAVQLLIEICGSAEKSSNDCMKSAVNSELNLLTAKREVQCLICSSIHQIFIANPNVAKLVHFQGYPSELIEVLVDGVPSMHICLNFIPELLQQADPMKQLFAIELAAQLCQHYPLPKSMSVARLCINVISTLITVVPCGERCGFFTRAVATLPHFSTVFPPLARDCLAALQQLGRVLAAHVTSVQSHVVLPSVDDVSDDVTSWAESSNPHVQLYAKIRRILFKIVGAD